jgi:hypothetical protein
LASRGDAIGGAKVGENRAGANVRKGTIQGLRATRDPQVIQAGFRLAREQGQPGDGGLPSGGAETAGQGSSSGAHLPGGALLAVRIEDHQQGAARGEGLKGRDQPL